MLWVMFLCSVAVHPCLRTFAEESKPDQHRQNRIRKEAAFQAFQSPFLRTAAAGKPVELGEDFWKRLRSARTKADLFRLGLISGLTCAPLKQNEWDSLFLKEGAFQENLAVYLAGRFAGEQATTIYSHLQARTLAQGEGALGVLRDRYVEEKLSPLVQNAPGSDYGQKIASTLKDPSLVQRAQAVLAEEESIQAVNAFAQVLAAEYAVLWLDAYVNDPSSWESVLLRLPAGVLALAGQLALMRSGNRSILLAAYTLATSKDKDWAPFLDEFVKVSVDRLDANVFEPFVSRAVSKRGAKGKETSAAALKEGPVSFLDQPPQ